MYPIGVEAQAGTQLAMTSRAPDQPLTEPELIQITGPPDASEIEHNLYLDFLTRKVMRGWMEHEVPSPNIPWTPVRKPLAECTVAFVSSAGVSLRSQPPFDQAGERRNPWWGDPSYRLIPRATRTEDTHLCHLHIDTSFGEQDLNCVLPLDRLAELEAAGEIGRSAPTHYSFMGYLLRPEEFLRTSVPAMIERMRQEQADIALLAPA
jgi:D-proline reductase (dithiol) PrdB